MAPKHGKRRSSSLVNKGVWTAEEDKKLVDCVEEHGAKKWKTIAHHSGLNRCHKSCRLRWLNYLRPNIKRGNITIEEEDLIIRLHNLLGNRWSLIAGRLPGRTDNEIKNYWNSHLSKKVNQEVTKTEIPSPTTTNTLVIIEDSKGKMVNSSEDTTQFTYEINDLIDFSSEETCCGIDWVDEFLSLDDLQY